MSTMNSLREKEGVGTPVYKYVRTLEGSAERRVSREGSAWTMKSAKHGTKQEVYMNEHTVIKFYH